MLLQRMLQLGLGRLKLRLQARAVVLLTMQHGHGFVKAARQPPVLLSLRKKRKQKSLLGEHFSKGNK